MGIHRVDIYGGIRICEACLCCKGSKDDRDRSALMAGYYAGKRGDPPESCPYEDHRTHTGAITWNRARRTKWWVGYKTGCSERRRNLLISGWGSS